MIKIMKMDKNAIIPVFKRQGDAGRDLYTLKETIIPPNQTVAIRTGICMALPENTVGFVRPRSGITLNGLECQVVESNTTIKARLVVKEGTVDSNYRGDINIIVKNESEVPVIVPAKTRLAQIVICNITINELEEVNDLNETNRGTNGFGSSGTTI